MLVCDDKNQCGTVFYIYKYIPVCLLKDVLQGTS